MTLQFPVGASCSIHPLTPSSHLPCTAHTVIPTSEGDWEPGVGLGARHSHSQEVRWYQGINPDMSLKPRLFLLHQVGPPHLYNNRGSLGNTDLG